MTRRALAFALVAPAACLGLVSPPRATDAQQPASPRRVGVLLALLAPDSKEAQAFRQGLRDAGYAEGRDVMIDQRRLRSVTAVGRRPVERKSSIPIVMAIVADPVGSDLVANLAQPGALLAEAAVRLSIGAS